MRASTGKRAGVLCAAYLTFTGLSLAHSTRQADGSLSACGCDLAGECRCERKWNIRFLSPKTGKVWGTYPAESAEALQRKVEELRKLEADLRKQFGDKPHYHDFDQAEGPYCTGCATKERQIGREALDLKWDEHKNWLDKAKDAYREKTEPGNPYTEAGAVLSSYRDALADAYKKLMQMRHQLLDTLKGHELTDAQLASVSRELDAALAPLQPLIKGGGASGLPAPTGTPGSAAEVIAAAKAGQSDQVAALLKSGTGANGQDERGYSALMWSIRSGHLDAAGALLTGGATINQQAKDGYTALMFAAMRNDEAAVKYLLEHGADKSLRQRNGFTALDIAGGKLAKPNMRALLK